MINRPIDAVKEGSLQSPLEEKFLIRPFSTYVPYFNILDTQCWAIQTFDLIYHRSTSLLAFLGLRHNRHNSLCIDTMSLPLGWEHEQWHFSGPSFVTWRCNCGSLCVTTHWHKGPIQLITRCSPISEHSPVSNQLHADAFAQVSLRSPFASSAPRWELPTQK